MEIKVGCLFVSEIAYMYLELKYDFRGMKGDFEASESSDSIGDSERVKGPFGSSKLSNVVQSGH